MKNNEQDGWMDGATLYGFDGYIHSWRAFGVGRFLPTTGDGNRSPRWIRQW